MTKRNAAYKDANFRKTFTHMQGVFRAKIDCVCYSYEGKSKLYDIVVPEVGAPIFRTNMKRTTPTAAHHEIDRFFNLALPIKDLV